MTMIITTRHSYYGMVVLICKMYSIPQISSHNSSIEIISIYTDYLKKKIHRYTTIFCLILFQVFAI